jgi:hypothetical protein
VLKLRDQLDIFPGTVTSVLLRQGMCCHCFQLVLALRKRWKYVSFFAAVSGPELGAANMASQDAEVAPVLAAAREVHLQRSLDIAWMS